MSDIKTIAVIDDDVYIGDMLEELLKKEGYDVLRAYSGTEALYLFSETRPSISTLERNSRVLAQSLYLTIILWRNFPITL